MYPTIDVVPLFSGPHGCNKLEAIQNTDYWKQYTVCYHIPNDEYGMVSY